MAACAAALVLAVVLPWTVFRGGRPEGVADRIKGGAGGPAELSLYLKGAADRLPDEAAVRAGDTVQVAYQAPEGRYGVIFSIDGRSAVTLHYPYGPGGETRLVSGRTVPLDEAYTLDDAPDYEIFFFVVGDRPLDPRNIFEAARGLAPKLAGNPRGALKQGTVFFKDYELKVLTLRKE
jgi:hypothetical protein